MDIHYLNRIINYETGDYVRKCEKINEEPLQETERSKEIKVREREFLCVFVIEIDK